MKFKRAVFCYLILRFDSRLHSWLMLLCESKKTTSARWLKGNQIEQVAKWVTNIFISKSDFDRIIKVLIGDKYIDKNKKDIIKLEKQVGKSIFDLWDTDPIFNKYPNLRGLARNKEFEKMWAKMKQKIK
ncbi:MAG: hypothetical protein ACOX7D_01345 [Alphaproteobacteria bacterium]